jgi:hypothetical protein
LSSDPEPSVAGGGAQPFGADAHVALVSRVRRLSLAPQKSPEHRAQLVEADFAADPTAAEQEFAE